jgi:epoxyqueuosine reductase
MQLTESLRQIADEMGCSALGVTTAEPLDGVADTIKTRRAEGFAGKLHFTYKDPETASDIRMSFPWAERVVVVSWPYMPAAGIPGDATAVSGRVARFATDDHYRGLRAALAAIQGALQDRGWKAEVVVDDDRLVDRAVAVRAGIGWWGKSTMVLDPRNGPWLLLGSVVTDADLVPTPPMVRDCGTCDACIPACPTGAIVTPGVLDASRCLAHWTQMGGLIPRELRRPMGDRIYGCDDCLDVCPPGIKRLATAQTIRGRIDLLELLAADDGALRAQYAHFYLPRRSPRFLRRNALVALGNVTAVRVSGGTAPQGEIEAVTGALAGYLGDPDEIYRVHAAWALGHSGVSNARELLQHQLRRERSDQVAEEISLTLDDLASPQ